MASCHLIKNTNIFAYKKFNTLAGYKVDLLFVVLFFKKDYKSNYYSDVN